MNRPSPLLFPGQSRPSTDFQAVRDFRRAPLLYVDVDLSVARSIAASSHLVLPISGNSFFSDQNAAQGNATVHFQDTNLGAPGTPVYISPGFIAAVPFTQLLIENAAQAGKILRILYGTDIDFKPSLSGALNIGGTVTTTPAPYTFGASYSGFAALAANTPSVIVTAAANVAGITLYRAAMQSRLPTNASCALLIKSGGNPTSVTDGIPVMSPDAIGWTGSELLLAGKLDVPVSIPAGYSLSYIASANESISHRSAIYTLL